MVWLPPCGRPPGSELRPCRRRIDVAALPDNAWAGTSTIKRSVVVHPKTAEPARHARRAALAALACAALRVMPGEAGWWAERCMTMTMTMAVAVAGTRLGRCGVRRCLANTFQRISCKLPITVP